MRSKLLSGLFVLAAGCAWPAVGAASTPTAVPIQQPAHASNVALTAVSCPTDRMCVAVGSYQNKSYMRSGLIESWNGTRWQIKAAPGLRVRHKRPVMLQDVSCASARSCVLIGSRPNYNTNPPGPTLNLSERWDGRHWRPIAVAALRGASEVDLASLSCVSATRCTAVGSVGNARTRAVIERYNGRRWRVSYRAPANAGPSTLNAVSCPTASTCVAVGQQRFPHGGSSRLVLARRGGRWQAIPLAAAGYPALTGVSCASATSCVLVGTNSGRVATPIARSFNGTALQPIAVPNAGRLTGVSCASSGSCLMTGNANAPAHTVGRSIADVWDGSTLTPAFSGLRATAACRSTFCMLVGSARRRAAAYRYRLGAS